MYLIEYISKDSTLLVLIDFCPVWSEFLLTKTFDILLEVIIEYQI